MDGERDRDQERKESSGGDERLLISRREFLDKLKRWSPAVTMLFMGSAAATTTLSNSGCILYDDYGDYDDYSRYERYADYSIYSRAGYCNITYCNGCSHNYTTRPTCYCNYVDYPDGC